MRLLLTLVALGALLWSGYWYVNATAVKGAFETWFQERRADGWMAEAAAIDVAGYPNRIDTTFSDLSLADPATGLAWEVPFFQILTLSYRPNHVIVVWPHEQRLATPYDKFDITSADMRASLVVAPSAAQALKRLSLTAENLEVAMPGEQADSTDLAALTLAAKRLGDSTSYRLGLRAEGVSPSLPWKAQVDPAGALPQTLSTLNADVTVTFDTPWDRNAIEHARPQPRAIEVKLAEAKWGKLELQLAGDLMVDSNGLPEGQLTVRARNWRDIIGLGVKSGTLPEVLADSLEDGLGLLAQLAGNPETLDVPLDFRRGRVLLGPVPIGPAPVLRLR